MKRRLYRISVFAGSLLGLCIALRAQAPNDAAEATRLVDLLDVHVNSVVADIGAGSRPLTIRIAPELPQGTVFSTDLQPTQLQAIRNAAASAGLNNVTVVEGALEQTNLPEQCCDGIFMRDVYHHFGNPPAMDRSLLRSLKPGGRIAVIDFPPRSDRTAAPGNRDQGVNHGILPADLINELKAAGFGDVHQVEWSSPGYFAVVGVRPR